MPFTGWEIRISNLRLLVDFSYDFSTRYRPVYFTTFQISTFLLKPKTLQLIRFIYT